MIKKMMILALIPVLMLFGYAAVRAATNGEPDYDIALGNGLSDLDIEINTYVEDPDKDELNYNMTIPNTFDLMAEDNELELYLEPETLAIAVRVKANGYVYASYNFNDTFAGKSAAVVNPIKSGVTLDLYKETTPVSTSFLDINPIATGELIPVAEATIQPITDGFRANVDFSHPEIQIRFQLNVTLDDGSLKVDIPSDSIEEYNPNIWNSATQYYILRNIVVFPYFGSIKNASDGYVLIPDGSGALITLEGAPEEKASFTLDIYGDDLGYMSPSFRLRALSIKPIQRVTIPLFGVVHDVGNTGFYVIGEQGANYASLNFKSTGLINDYYATYFSFRYRESYEQYQSRSNEDQYRISFQDDPNDYDVTMRYVFVSGAAADYVGIAKSYRDHLSASGQLGDRRRQDFAQPPTKFDFIGTEITDGILRLKTKEITTYEEIADILKTIQDDGYTELTTALKTFSLDEWGYRFEVFRSLGGRNDFRTLLSDLDEADIDFSYYLDYVRSYNTFSSGHAQTLSKREIYHVELSRMYFAHLVYDTRLYDQFAKEDIADLLDYGIDGVAMNGLDRAIYTSFDDGVVNSTRNMSEVNAMLARYQASSIRTGVHLPDAYMYSYISTYYDAPLSSSEFSVSAASIPFVQLVLSGHVDMYSPYLNFASDEARTLLRLVEYGVFPSYVLTGGSTYDLKRTNSSNYYITEYDVLKNRIDAYYDTIEAGLSASINAEMTDHTFVAEGVVLVTFDNGTQILLNYNNASRTVDALSIPAMGYVVIP